MGGSLYEANAYIVRQQTHFSTFKHVFISKALSIFFSFPLSIYVRKLEERERERESPITGISVGRILKDGEMEEGRDTDGRGLPPRNHPRLHRVISCTACEFLETLVRLCMILQIIKYFQTAHVLFFACGRKQVHEVVFLADFRCPECQQRVAEIISKINGEKLIFLQLNYTLDYYYYYILNKGKPCSPWQ